VAEIGQCSYRTEKDLLGEIQVSEQALYGAQTARAIENFPLGRQRDIGSFPHFIKALLLIKKAAALANREIGALPADRADAIVGAVDQLLAHLPPGQFPIHHLHGGGGTSANMNANEVVANFGEELLGGRRGARRWLDPNDHVNLHQSTNDVYPTACHMAVLFQWPGLRDALASLRGALSQVGETFRPQVRLARTCLQDAVDISYGDYLGGMAAQIGRLEAQLDESVDRLHSVSLGGTICGRREDVPDVYLSLIVPVLASITGDARYKGSADLFDAAQNPDEMVAVSARLDLMARSLIKIAKDLRLLSSGPEAGLGEIRLPAVQPGSSIMPWKINPVIPEFLIQIGFRVIGNHAMCAAGLDHGELDLNVWESSIVFPILESMELLECGIRIFTDKCVRGLEPTAEVNNRHARTLIPRLTRLAREHGYQRVTQVCKQAHGDPELLKRLLNDQFGDHENAK
jgi:aspartate ammonia-lyase